MTKMQRKPTQFKPIHPVRKQLTPTQNVLAPIPRKLLDSPEISPSLVSNRDLQSSNNSLLSNSTRGCTPSNSLLAGSSVKRSSERKVFGKAKVDKSGAFPTADHGRDSGIGIQESASTKKNKPGVSIFRRRKSENKEVTRPQSMGACKRDSVSSKCLEGRDSLQIQVEELAQRLRTSVEGSDDLRKRLAMISKYYEGTVHRLSENIVSLKKEQASMQGDLTKQIKNIDRERLVAIKRAELLIKEEQMAKFKRKQRQRL